MFLIYIDIYLSNKNEKNYKQKVETYYYLLFNHVSFRSYSY
jgi:hypothetical protein